MQTPIVHFSFLQPVFNCQGTTLIAKIDAERNRPTTVVSTADLAAFLRGGFQNRSLEDPISAQLVDLVELIGLEPTTPCLQSRCSPS